MKDIFGIVFFDGVIFLVCSWNGVLYFGFRRLYFFDFIIREFMIYGVFLSFCWLLGDLIFIDDVLYGLLGDIVFDKGYIYEL